MLKKAASIALEVKKAIVGKDEVIYRVLMAILAGGHILLEDIPGVGKTTLALSFSRAMSLKYSRQQFTPDVMPSDVVGFSIFDKDSGQLVYKPGSAMCNLYLADEINRASSKTQSALLEVMEEGNITIDGQTYPTPKPFIVMATQNPLGFTGTQMLPESQLDRFMICLSLGYPTVADEVEIMKRKQGFDPLESIERVADAGDVISMRKAAGEVYVSDAIYDYVARLTRATRENSAIRLGISPRGTIALISMARASAYLSGRDYVVPEDVANVFLDVGMHRIVLSSQSRIGSVSPRSLLEETLHRVHPPRIEQA